MLQERGQSTKDAINGRPMDAQPKRAAARDAEGTTPKRAKTDGRRAAPGASTKRAAATPAPFDLGRWAGDGAAPDALEWLQKRLDDARKPKRYPGGREYTFLGDPMSRVRARARPRRFRRPRRQRPAARPQAPQAAAASPSVHIPGSSARPAILPSPSGTSLSAPPLPRRPLPPHPAGGGRHALRPLQQALAAPPRLSGAGPRQRRAADARCAARGRAQGARQRVRRRGRRRRAARGRPRARARLAGRWLDAGVNGLGVPASACAAARPSRPGGACARRPAGEPLARAWDALRCPAAMIARGPCRIRPLPICFRACAVRGRGPVCAVPLQRRAHGGQRPGGWRPRRV